MRIDSIKGSETDSAKQTNKQTLPTDRSAAPDGCTGELYPTHKKELTAPTCRNLTRKPEEQGALPQTFYEAGVTLTPKSGTDTTKKEIVGWCL